MTPNPLTPRARKGLISEIAWLQAKVAELTRDDLTPRELADYRLYAARLRGLQSALPDHQVTR